MAARYLVLGRQGAGKGTQAMRLAGHSGACHISTGNLFRAAMRADTASGRTAKGFIDRGELVPDAVVISMVAERLARDDCVDRGFVLDGFPRTRGQAEELTAMLRPEDLDAAIDIDVPPAVVLRRLSGRRACVICDASYHVDAPPEHDWTCDIDGGDVVQRDDDTETAITRRLELYEKETGPVLGYYAEQGLLVIVDGQGTVDEVFERVLKATRL